MKPTSPILRAVAAGVLALSLSGAGLTPALAQPAPAAVEAGGARDYAIDPTHTQVRITWNHMGLSNPGATFEAVEGTLHIDPSDPSASRVSVRIPVASADTGVPALDAMFQNEAFFDAANHPDITFESTAVRFTGLGNAFEVDGNLTIRGVTQAVTLQARLNGTGVHPMTGAPVVGFAASTRVNRSDFGLEVALPMVGDDIEVSITVEASAASDPT
jgi:polyisoprenoid-binding protein YceI